MSIIRVDNLGKRYIIGHDRRAGGMFRYKSLRDTLAHQSRAFWQRCRHPLSPNRENTELEDFWALRDVSFEIQPGERVGIIGRNGAGKSTLLKLLSRITEPTTGRIELNGRVASLLEVGTGFHPELSGRENIYLNGAILGMTRVEIKRKFDAIVDFAEVEKFLDTPVKRYSSGMYVRLAFSVAAHLEPEILLVDEVLAVGDAAFQKKCLGKMEDVATNEGRTVLFVSHNMGAIMALCSKAICLLEGKVAMIDQANRVVDFYMNRNPSSLGTHPSKLSMRTGRRVTGPVSIVGVEMVSCSPIASGSDLRFTLCFVAHKSMVGLSIGATIFSYTNGPVGTLFTDSTIDIATHSPVNTTLRISDIGLAPGHYYMGFSIGKGGISEKRVDYDIAVGEPSFEVAPWDAPNTRSVFEWNSGWGSIDIRGATIETNRQ